MSLIHEALKKAEQQRQLGEPPTLASPYGTPRRQRSSLPIVLPLIAVALGAGWWISRSPVVPPTASAEEKTVSAAPLTATPNATVNRTAAAAAPAEAPSSSAAERRPNSSRAGMEAMPPPGLTRNAPPLPRGAPPAAAKTPTLKEIAERESEPMPAGANPLAPGEVAPQALAATPLAEKALNDPEEVAQKSATKRTLGEAPVTVPSTAPTGIPAIAAMPAPNKPNVGNAEKPTKPADAALSRNPQNAIAATAPAPTAPPTATPPAASKPAATMPTNPPAAPAPVTAPATSKAVAAAPAASPPGAVPVDHTPMYWELPLNLRKDLPALKLTMHVYSSEPAQRFVVMNGNRQQEGDDLGAEVKLTEIRADGVVLEFHGQKFLVPRGGG